MVFEVLSSPFNLAQYTFHFIFVATLLKLCQAALQVILVSCNPVLPAGSPTIHPVELKISPVKRRMNFLVRSQ